MRRVGSAPTAPAILFREEVSMKVHVLWRDYYEESYIVGIYTEEGKRKKFEEMKHEAIQYCKTWGVEYEKTLLKKKEERAIHLRKVNQAIEASKNSPENKAFRQLKKSLIKEDESLLRDIHWLQRKVEEFSSPEKALEIYMSDENLIWLEKEVVE